MKKTLLSSVAVTVLFFAGCSSKEPVVDQPQEKAVQQTAQNGGEVQEMATEEVGSNMQEVGSESAASNTNEMSLMDIQSKFQTVYFDFDKYNIRSDQEKKVTADAAVAKEAPESIKIRLEGNCDEWGSDEYNFALGLKRAKSVKEALTAQGVDADRIKMVSYGESNPVCKEHTKECWAKNRRVDITVLP